MLCITFPPCWVGQAKGSPRREAQRSKKKSSTLVRL